MSLRKNVLIYGFSILFFLVLILFNLQNQYAFTGDPARDTLKSLRILQNKEITFIGPPLSLGQNELRETYFSSAIYYIGALGLAGSELFGLPDTSPLGPVVLIAFINASALIPLTNILRERDYKPQIIYLLLALYITNPVVVNYSRIFWNPSPLIGLGVWGVWAFHKAAPNILKSKMTKNHNIFAGVFGLIAAAAVYFHYFGAVLMLTGVGLWIWKKDYRKTIIALSAFILALAPFVLFEIRNSFYLTQSLVYNLTNSSASFASNKLEIMLTIPTVLLGVTQDFFGTPLFDIGQYAVALGLLLWSILLWHNRKNPYILFFLIPAMVTVLISRDVVRMQYLFIGLGALPACGLIPSTKKAKLTILAIIFFQAATVIHSISQPPRQNSGTSFPTLAELQQATDHIVDLHSEGNSYNITENITGDARALYLRFYNEKDKKLRSDLRNELSYENLEEIYVLTPSLEKTLVENRWEFAATENLELAEVININDFKLLFFKKDKSF